MFLIKKFKKQIIQLYLNKIGFTLIEMLASMFIFALLTGIFLANYHGANQRNKLIMAAQKLASDIRMAQSFALGAREFGADNIPQGGWGVRFDEGTSNYKIFADDITVNKQYDSGEADKTKGGRIIDLPDGVTIYLLSAGDPTDIVFLPPDPTTYINGAADQTVLITLKDSKSNTTKKIEVNFFGLIDVVD